MSDTLNEAQREAIEAIDGPVLILAGAGTGKTRTLTARLAHILKRERAWPSQILAVTFTNKAAREMQARAQKIIGSDTPLPWLGTFHAMSARMLRTHAAHAGLESNFTILDKADQLRLVKEILLAQNIDTKRTPPALFLNAIERFKDRALAPDQIPQEENASHAGISVRGVYTRYQTRLKALNAVDFGDLLAEMLRVFERAPDVLEDYRRRFHYILVDEYQDTNTAQYMWLRLLAGKRNNICCVGDEDQSIYGWRGAQIENILRFEKDFPGAKVIRLECNYRSTPYILNAASGLIGENRARLGKTLWTEQKEGEKLRVVYYPDDRAEAAGIARDSLALRNDGHKLDEMAILTRTSAQMQVFETAFAHLNLPYRVVGALRFYDRAEIRDAVAYLRLAAQPADDLAFARIVNLPRRGIGATTLAKLRAHAGGAPLLTSIATLDDDAGLGAKPRAALAAFARDVGNWHREAQTRVPAKLAEHILTASGTMDMWRADTSFEAEGKRENLAAFLHELEDFDTLDACLEHIALVSEPIDNTDDEKVSLMTLHRAKGLEFDTVFLPGWEEELFPHFRALESGRMTEIEEERRLAYVGITRARLRARISHVQSRWTYGYPKDARPSRFIDEIPPDCLERVRSQPISTPRHRQAQRSAPVPDIRIGTMVRHSEFGEGRVVGADGNKLTIDFSEEGRVKIMRDFVEVMDIN